MDIFLEFNTWVALITLVFLEVVLGIDNIIFISIITDKLPKAQQAKARNIGLILALVMRLGLLASISYIIKLKDPIFTILFEPFNINQPISIRDLILLAGGLFLVAKSTSEIFKTMEGPHEQSSGRKVSSIGRAILMIILIDMVFSFDSILTAVGLVDEIIIMMLAVIISMIIMIIFLKRISNFINGNPTIQILALAFLILIGFTLVMEAFHNEIPKGYIYFSVIFSLIVELINKRVRKNNTKPSE